ncbi:T9SS type B sorting domain-containing protein [Flavobacterium flavipallidum]|uniref:T9SS type B sorting domain-containing protein n=1 Tax=Flavobacterium flavipallidum TaxID=3139140 RepID=A0ABU9HPB2_9FLAO
MKKNLLLLVFICLANILFSISTFAQPTVSSPVYYCQGSTATALTATPSNPSATLRWYDALTGGTEYPAAPIPSTTTVGTTFYYVTETIGGIESSPRTRIEVRVLADNGSDILLLRCDRTQITAPATIYDAVFFDWTNTAGIPNQYTYYYSIDGATPIYGTKNNGTNLEVTGLSPGQSVTLTVWHTTYPCDISSVTCTVACNPLLPRPTPTFTQVAPICAGDPPPTLPTTSLEGYRGTWSPAVDNTATTTYTFTPANICMNTQTMTIVVNPDSPGFIDSTICSGSPAPILETTSPTGVTGTWTPATVDNMNTAKYKFEPDSGQCAGSQEITITVLPSNTLVDFTWTVSQAFEENQKITITATNAGGDYLYQLDDGPYQSSNVFEYVSSGSHSVTVMDQTGCSMPNSITKSGIIVINYPKYFTPNNDGYNDFWNISELSSQPYAYIRIFDRYGKFLKQISPNGAGWNGTYNGHNLPSDDYWFVIHYLENNVVKEFKSHFSLKR